MGRMSDHEARSSCARRQQKYPRGGSVYVANGAAKKLAQSLSLFLVLGPTLQGCHSQKRGGGPSIEFTHIPPAAQGGPERVDTISGWVRNARPNQQIVIYAHSGQWWVQPLPDHLIPIKADSKWSTETHLGFEYGRYWLSRTTIRCRRWM